jgi:hypothetical protein
MGKNPAGAWGKTLLFKRAGITGNAARFSHKPAKPEPNKENKECASRRNKSCVGNTRFNFQETNKPERRRLAGSRSRQAGGDPGIKINSQNAKFRNSLLFMAKKGID